MPPLLYSLVIEPFANCIRMNTNIKGTCFNNSLVLKVQLFAVDMLLTLKRDSKSLQALSDTLDLFQIISGLKFNENKTKRLHINCNKKDISKMFAKYTVLDNKIKHEGVTLTNYMDETLTVNYNNILK